jgi:hypothetical protein
MIKIITIDREYGSGAKTTFTTPGVPLKDDGRGGP